MMKPYFKEKQLLKNPCTLEISYTLGCMELHPTCIVKYSARGRKTFPMQCLICEIICSTSHMQGYRKQILVGQAS